MTGRLLWQKESDKPKHSRWHISLAKGNLYLVDPRRFATIKVLKGKSKVVNNDILLDFDQATEFEYKCPECGDLLEVRHDLEILKKFVGYFDRKGFIIIFGTEHNTPEMIPLTVSSRGKIPLDDSLKKIAWKGASVIAAHQYLHAQNLPGYIDKNGLPRMDEKMNFEKTGQLVIEYFLNNRQYES